MVMLRSLSQAIAIMWLAFLFTTTTPSVSAEWIKSAVILPIQTYSNGSGDSLPSPLFESGIETALNQKGDIVAIASKLEIDQDSNPVISGGLVQVYQQQPSSTSASASSTWTQLGNNIIVSTGGEWTGSNFLSLNEGGNILAIGTRFFDNGRGQVQVLLFNDQNQAWENMGVDGSNIIQGSQEGEHSGASVQLSANGYTLAVGSPFYTHEDSEKIMDKVGRVKTWEYDISTGTWVQLGQLIGEAASDEFGTALALSSQADLLAVGAPSNDAVVGLNRRNHKVFASSYDSNANDNHPGRQLRNSGHVRVFKLVENESTKEWQQIGPDIDGESVLDYSGSAIAMSYNKVPNTSNLSTTQNLLAVGAYMNDGESNHDGSLNQFDQRGHVRVFGYDDSTSNWEQIYYDIDGDSPADFSGKSIAINSDGSRLVTGATGSNGVDGNLPDAGQVRVFELSENGSGWTQVGKDLDGGVVNLLFGSSVEISGDGNRLIIGAPRFDAGATDGVDGNNDGAVYVFDWVHEDNEGGTGDTDDNPNGGNDSSGSSMLDCFVSVIVAFATILISVA